MSNAPEKRHIGKHACEKCRKLKIRCLTDTLQQHGKCRKCYATGADCEWKEISTKRRRKRTDARVTDLERQIQSLENTLTGLRDGFIGASNVNASKEDGPLSMQSHSTPSDTTGPPVNSIENSGSIAPADIIDPAQQYPSLSLRGQDFRDLQHIPAQIDSLQHISGIQDLSLQQRAGMFEDFRAMLLPQYPVITLDDETSFVQMEETEPLLAVAIVTAASSLSEPSVFKVLHANLLQHLCQKILIEGDKSMEILQALLVSAVWFCPPDTLEYLSFYQWTHMAGTMALELGLGGKTSWQANRRAVAALMEDASPLRMQTFRTMFGVYLTCSRIAISFRRQRMISYSSSTATALQIFAGNATSLNDQCLVAWMRLQNIAEDIENMKSNVEPKSDSELTERDSVKSDLSLFNDRLDEWASKHKSLICNGALRIEFCFCKAKLHELALYVDYDIERLSLPLLFYTGPPNEHCSSQVSLNATYIRALLSFVADCQSIFDAVLETNIQKLRCCPMLTFFRVAYAFKALAMLRRRAHNSESNISKIIDEESLRWGRYVHIMSEHMEAASDSGRFVVPAMVVSIRDSFRNRWPATSSHRKPDKPSVGTAQHLHKVFPDPAAEHGPQQQTRESTESDASHNLVDTASTSDWYDQLFDISMPMFDDISLFGTQQDLNFASYMP